MLEFVWTGDLDDDCSCVSVEPYVCHAEDMGKGRWYCAVSAGDRLVFHSQGEDLVPLTGDAARRLCQMVVAWDRLTRGSGYGVVLKGGVQ